MKIILIVIFLNLANMSDPSVLVHKNFNSVAECTAAAADLQSKITDKSIKMSSFCLSQADLLID